jgi:hydroxymethylglutaryl-CoA reductase (NADPH)
MQSAGDSSQTSEQVMSGTPESGAIAPRIPRDRVNDYTEEQAQRRRAFLHEQTGGDLSHVARCSIEAPRVSGNIENFIGAAQVPIGVAGPILIDGEHARGWFYVPLATTEGTLVASHNRGMRLLSECGGVKCTVVEQAMQRAPVFLFPDARAARNFGAWVTENLSDIRAAAEATTRVGKLIGIHQYQVGPARFLRFNYTTGDAAGQNLTGKATLAACEWIKKHWAGEALEFLLSGNIDTDKKHSLMNTLHTRGRRVVAEAVLDKDKLKALMGVDTRELFRWRQVQNAGAFIAGSASNGAQVANGVAALFIATGQDAADVSESQAAVSYTQRLDNGDYYWSITLTSLIIATYGGGTSLPTQRQCLELLGCNGQGKANKLAEICGAVALAGEISLASAVVHGDWVSSHETYGRNRK